MICPIACRSPSAVYPLSPPSRPEQTLWRASRPTTSPTCCPVWRTQRKVGVTHPHSIYLLRDHWLFNDLSLIFVTLGYRMVLGRFESSPPVPRVQLRSFAKGRVAINYNRTPKSGRISYGLLMKSLRGGTGARREIYYKTTVAKKIFIFGQPSLLIQ